MLCHVDRRLGVEHARDERPGRRVRRHAHPVDQQGAAEGIDIASSDRSHRVGDRQRVSRDKHAIDEVVHAGGLPVDPVAMERAEQAGPQVGPDFVRCAVAPGVKPAAGIGAEDGPGRC